MGADLPAPGVVMIDDFERGERHWWQPPRSGTFSGVARGTDGRAQTFIATAFRPPPAESSMEAGSIGTMRLHVTWDTHRTFVAPDAEGGGSHLARIYLPAELARAPERLFTADHTVEVFLHGDGSGHAVRFLLRDGAKKIEGSPWYTVDWHGWRHVQWDFSRDGVTGWVSGDGQLSGSQIYFDSFLVTRNPESEHTELNWLFSQLQARPTSAFSPISPADLPPDFLLNLPPEFSWVPPATFPTALPPEFSWAPPAVIPLALPPEFSLELSAAVDDQDEATATPAAEVAGDDLWQTPIPGSTYPTDSGLVWQLPRDFFRSFDFTPTPTPAPASELATPSLLPTPWRQKREQRGDLPWSQRAE